MVNDCRIEKCLFWQEDVFMLRDEITRVQNKFHANATGIDVAKLAFTVQYLAACCILHLSVRACRNISKVMHSSIQLLL